MARYLSRAGQRQKRLIDVAGACAFLVLSLPVLAVIALAILVTAGRPVLYRQERPGRKGRLFTLLKFRTMRSAVSEGARQAPDGERLTELGRLLRRTSLDELPQLWNVIKGDMSLVGPRPLLPEYLERYTPEQVRRHEVPPGMTGLVQASGRNLLTWEQKFALDTWYVDNWSLRLDLWILWRTALCTLSRRGISAPGHATMPEFCGTGISRSRKETGTLTV